MELRELLTVDAESLSPACAKQVARDVIEVLTKGVSGEDQAPLRALLITSQEIATGRKVGDTEDTLRQDVLAKIQDAEARGDKRTARYLIESIGKHDMASVEIEEFKSDNPVQRFIVGENTAADALANASLQERIDARTQELLRIDGAKYNYSMKLARKQAATEVAGPAAYEDDINPESAKPDRQTILDAHKAP